MLQRYAYARYITNLNYINSNEDGEIYDYDLFFVGLDNKGDVVVKTSKDNIYFRFSELDDVMRFEIINSIIKDVYGK